MIHFETDVTIACSRFKAQLLLFVGVPLLSGIVLLFVVIMATAPLMSAKLGMQEVATVYLLFPVLVVLFSWIVWAFVSNRETLFTTFRISRAGLVVENSRYGVLIINWNEITRATYSKTGKMITLESPKLLRPLAIMSFGRNGLTPQFMAARTVIQEAIPDRWKERWF